VYGYTIAANVLGKEWKGCRVAHVCNPSYSGGRDQEDHGSKPALTNSPRNLILKKKKITKKDWWSGFRYRPGVQVPVTPHPTPTKKNKPTNQRTEGFWDLNQWWKPQGFPMKQDVLIHHRVCLLLSKGFFMEIWTEGTNLFRVALWMPIRVVSTWLL
jgi:hypothetical protein